MKFKTVIYGDSFAEPHKAPAQFDEYNWLHHYISKVEGTPLEDLESHRVPHPTYLNKGLSGSNMWMAYCELLKDVDTIKPSNVIFVHTCATRAPLEAPEDARNSFSPDILPENKMMPNSTKKFLKEWYKTCLWYDPFHHNFLPFFGESIFFAVERVAIKHNLNLIHIVPFKGEAQPLNNLPYENIVNKYPMIYGLQDVSQLECGDMMNYFDIVSDTTTWNSNSGDQTTDSRRCHLNENNNKLLADILYNVKDNEVINFAEQGVDVSENTWKKYNRNLKGFQ